MNILIKILLSCFLYIFFFLPISFSEIVKDIKISGNERISDQTILMFSDIKVGSNVDDIGLNIILKALYDTSFFNNVTVELKDNIFSIVVDEAPLIQNINLIGVKAKRNKELILSNLIHKNKSSFNKLKLSDEINQVKSILKREGFYFAKVEASIEELDNNLVNIEYKVDLGDKSKISKITFVGNKIFKDRKLKSIIISEEYKFWKFLSGKKFVREELINFDERLLKNFYLNNGYYNVNINSSFAKLINKNEFELIYNINSGEKILFDNLNIVLPDDFNFDNYTDLNKLLLDLKDEPYSINSVNKIIDEIDKITSEEEFKSIQAFADETINNNKLDINFIIEESEKTFVEKINIYGNNVTRENVIRNQLEIDEGDPFNELLTKKSENNIKSLNFFKTVETSVKDGKSENSKIIDIEIKEKATGEIAAGAGVGTDGGTVSFGVKENNYLGKGIGLKANATVSGDTIKGIFSVTNPNYNNSSKLVFVNAQAIETDKLKKFGYKTNKNGFEIGSSFEYLDDFRIGLATSNFFERIETNSTASARQKKQAGNYFDSFIKLTADLDKRNQKFRTTDGYYSTYDLSLPIISDTNTLSNLYSYKIYTELFEDNVSALSISLGNSFSVSNDDIKLSERLFIPSKKLRGFENGKIGPKDGKDFVGGNNYATLNLQSNLPMVFPNSQNLDAIIFFDAANLWGVDYDSSISDGSKIRSSIGLGFDWLTVIGPLNFSLSQAISKQNTDIEESFRFNLGTTF